ncbi:MAG: glycosyltransferase [Candidatus Aminicenantes bacterium]|nr:glycosyltransferase [Candidatus Aminicenantes bacterium]
MLAPEPFFQPRGTPLSEYFRIKALSDLGHKIDLVTYHLGEDVKIKNLRILRIPNLFLIREIKIGPSWAKIPLDFLLFWKAFFQLVRSDYDLIFSHEEAALLGVILAKIWRRPHLYDMHSSLPQQLENFNFSRSKMLRALFKGLEKFILKNSQSIIVICLDLLQKVAKGGYKNRAVLVENFLDFKGEDFSAQQIEKKRQEFASRGEKIILYTGNFQSYQGIPLLLEAAKRIKEKAVFLFVGGNGARIEEMRQKVKTLKIEDRIVFNPEIAPSLIPLFISVADVLVSPRTSGTNTPLKIYSFMKSGKPIVATNLWTHTQVLSPEISVLAEPDPQSLADGIIFALHQEEAQDRARKCKQLAEREYTYPRYLEKIRLSLQKAQKAS